MQIGLDKDIIHIDIGIIRSKVKVGRITFVKKWFPLIILITVDYRGFIFHMLIGLNEGLTSTDFVFFRSKVMITKVTFVKKRFPLILLRTIYHRASVFNVLIDSGLGSLGQRVRSQGSHL